MLAATGPSTTVFVSAGLAFDEFVDNSYAAWLDHHPELVTSLGIAADLGMTNDRLDDLSPEGIAAAQQLEVAILAALHAYDRESLDPEQQLTFDVYEWWLQHLVDGHRWAYHDYPVHHFVNSYNDQLLRGLTEEHPLATEQDAADYLAKVAQIAPQVGHLIEGLETRRDLGVLPPDFILEMTIGRLKGDLGSSSPSADTVDVERLALVARLDAALAEIPGLTEARHRELAAEVRTEAAASFVPAWIALIEHLESLRSLVTADAGLWRLPDGDAYYAYVLRDQTSTSLTAAEIHELGLAEVERVTSEMSSTDLVIRREPAWVSCVPWQRATADSSPVSVPTARAQWSPPTRS
jgi:uncharacterized protein (DUF885 family)